MCDEFFVPGEKYDEERGFRENCEQYGGEYEPYMVEFIRMRKNNVWDRIRVHVPLPMCHEKCNNDNLVEWYTKVYCGQDTDIAFVGVLRSI
jgi:hypothetical protein